MTLLCERCGREGYAWTIHKATLFVGSLQREPRLCRVCTDEVQSAILGVLQQTEKGTP